jgi:hypothetical protein
MADLGQLLCANGRLVLIDIVDEGISGRLPLIGWCLHAFLSFVEEVWRNPPSALAKLNARLSRAWLRHLSRETFISRAILVRAAAALPNAAITFDKREHGLTTYVTVVWDRGGTDVGGLQSNERRSGSHS